MGVKELWSILDPIKKHRALKELSGQILAVDLSVWICETQQLQAVFTKPYLRNLFFRVLHLIQLGVKPVFVTDGTPPEIKWDTIQKRLGGSGSSRGGHRGGRAAPRGEPPMRMNRSHFKRLVNECCMMLDSLGIPHIQSQGEAEAMCALLNTSGLVDGCITNDGDAFLYGAKQVYKDFTTNSKDPHVESYSMVDIERELSLTRDKLVGMALLLGCDYLPKGVPGIGKEMVLKLIKEIGDLPLLERFTCWPKDALLKQCVEASSGKKPTHCGQCGHQGSLRDHQRGGCTLCDSPRYCDPSSPQPCSCMWHQAQRVAQGRACEVAVWKKARDVEGFPNKQVLDEFLRNKDKIPVKPFLWRRPKPFVFQKFAVEKMEWEETYAMEKVLPLLSLVEMRQRMHCRATDYLLQPHSIVKSRVRQGIACFEVQWYKIDSDDVTEQPYYVTIEHQDLFSDCFPHLTQQYTDAQANKKSKPKGKKTKATDSDKESVHADKLDTDIGVAGVHLRDIDLGDLAGLQICNDNIDKQRPRYKYEKKDKDIHQLSIQPLEHTVPSQTSSKVLHSARAPPGSEETKIPQIYKADDVSCSPTTTDEEQEEYLPLSQRLQMNLKATSTLHKVSKKVMPVGKATTSVKATQNGNNKLLVKNSVKPSTSSVNAEFQKPQPDTGNTGINSVHVVRRLESGPLFCISSEEEENSEALDEPKTDTDHKENDTKEDHSDSVKSALDLCKLLDMQLKKPLQKSSQPLTKNIFDLCSLLEESSISESFSTLEAKPSKSENTVNGNTDDCNGNSGVKYQENNLICPFTEVPNIDVSTPAHVKQRIDTHTSSSENIPSPIPIYITDTPEHGHTSKIMDSTFECSKISIKNDDVLNSDVMVTQSNKSIGFHSKQQFREFGIFHLESSVMSDWSQCSGLAGSSFTSNQQTVSASASKSKNSTSFLNKSEAQTVDKLFPGRDKLLRCENKSFQASLSDLFENSENQFIDENRTSIEKHPLLNSDLYNKFTNSPQGNSCLSNQQHIPTTEPPSDPKMATTPETRTQHNILSPCSPAVLSLAERLKRKMNIPKQRNILSPIRIDKLNQI